MSGVYWQPDLSKGISTSFNYDVGAHGWGNQELQEYTNSAKNSFIDADGSSIVIRAIAEKDGNGKNCFTSARLVSKACLEEERGYVEACIKTPFAKGIWFAFWLLPKQPFSWPGDGEVDICEAWDGKMENGTCLHWGHYNGQDWNKHRVLHKPLEPDPTYGHRFGFAWDCHTKKLLWFTDGKPTMKATIPHGTRSMKEFQILLNVAMGGNVMNGSTPIVPSTHDMIVSDLKMYREVPGGWDGFASKWNSAEEGNTM